MCMFRYHLSILNQNYLIPEEHELWQNCKGLEILSESPQKVPKETSVETRVKEQSKHCCWDNEVVGLNGVKIVVVACVEKLDDCVQDIG